jgi:hypothetical protein
MVRDRRIALPFSPAGTELLRDQVNPGVMSGDLLGEITARVAAGAVRADTCSTTPRGRTFTKEAAHG